MTLRAVFGHGWRKASSVPPSSSSCSPGGREGVAVLDNLSTGTAAKNVRPHFAHFLPGSICANRDATFAPVPRDVSSARHAVNHQPLKASVVPYSVPPAAARPNAR